MSDTQTGFCFSVPQLQGAHLGPRRLRILRQETGIGLKKRLSPGDFPRLPKTLGPGNKKTVTRHALWPHSYEGAHLGPRRLWILRQETGIYIFIYIDHSSYHNSHHKSWAQISRIAPAPKAPARGHKTKGYIEGDIFLLFWFRSSAYTTTNMEIFGGFFCPRRRSFLRLEAGESG